MIKVGLNIDNSKISCAVSEIVKDKNIKLLSYQSIQSNILKKNIITDFEQLSHDIKSLILESEKTSQTKINSVNLNIPINDSLSRFYNSEIDNLKNQIPELPDDRKKRYTNEYNLSNYDASVLTSDKSVSDFFDNVIKVDSSLKKSSKIVVNWITSELFSLLNENNLEIKNSPITSENLGKLVKLIIDDVISGKIAKDVLLEMFSTKKDPDKIIEDKGLKQVTDTSLIEIIVDNVINENQKMVEQYLSGKEKLLGFFVGQAMKKSKGKANPKILNEILKEKLSKKN